MKSFSSSEPRPYAQPAIPAVQRGMPYADADDRLRHRRYIEAMAEEMERAVQEVEPIYEEALEYLAAKARIVDYLPIFVSKIVRRVLKALQKTNQSM